MYSLTVEPSLPWNVFINFTYYFLCISIFRHRPTRFQKLLSHFTLLLHFTSIYNLTFATLIIAEGQTFFFSSIDIQLVHLFVYSWFFLQASCTLMQQTWAGTLQSPAGLTGERSNQRKPTWSYCLTSTCQSVWILWEQGRISTEASAELLLSLSCAEPYTVAYAPNAFMNISQFSWLVTIVFFLTDYFSKGCCRCI